MPGLFDVIEGIVNEQKRQTGNNNGMYILTSSESYNLIQGVTQSMAGRVAIINVKSLSFNDTGLACYLARINSPLLLQNSY